MSVFSGQRFSFEPERFHSGGDTTPGNRLLRVLPQRPQTHNIPTAFASLTPVSDIPEEPPGCSFSTERQGHPSVKVALGFSATHLNSSRHPPPRASCCHLLSDLNEIANACSAQFKAGRGGRGGWIFSSPSLGLRAVWGKICLWGGVGGAGREIFLAGARAARPQRWGGSGHCATPSSSSEQIIAESRW